MKLAATVQFALVGIVLAGCALLPRAGSGILLLSLDPANVTDRAFLTEHRLTIIGSGRLRGSLLVHAGKPLALTAMLARGVIPIAAPTALCAPPAAPPGTA